MPVLGAKWECYSCGQKFYDLGRPEPVCPKCGANQRQAKAAELAEAAAARKKRREEPVLRPFEDDEELLREAEVDFDEEEDEVPAGEVGIDEEELEDEA